MTKNSNAHREKLLTVNNRQKINTAKQHKESEMSG